ncbi:MAG TPA: virulence factor [Candidatus Limnocylindrales bacterium]|nr:virulence factor [Candidatus Limnocylindrales bacterium]
MARYRVLAWRDIPTQVQATDDAGGSVNRKMARWFMQEISRISMREGLAATDDYLAAFDWSAWTEREGTAEAVADAVEAELAATLGRKPDGHPLRGPGGAIETS